MITLGIAGVASVGITLITAGSIYSWGWNTLFSEVDREGVRNALRAGGVGSIADNI